MTPEELQDCLAGYGWLVKSLKQQIEELQAEHEMMQNDLQIVKLALAQTQTPPLIVCG